MAGVCAGKRQNETAGAHARLGDDLAKIAAEPPPTVTGLGSSLAVFIVMRLGVTAGAVSTATRVKFSRIVADAAEKAATKQLGAKPHGRA